MPEDDAGGGAAVALTRLAMGSVALESEGLSSAGFRSTDLASASFGSDGHGSATRIAASAGRGRGSGPGASPATGIMTTEPNIGDGWRPACRNSALAMIAVTAANASAPATMSFGLCSNMRIARPRAASASIAAALVPRRRRGISSSLAICLGTFLHLMSLLSWSGPQRRSERCDIARWLSRRRRERQRQCHGHAGSLVDLALHLDLPGVQANQPFHDRHPDAGAFVPPLIGSAGLEEGIADPLQVVGRDA